MNTLMRLWVGVQLLPSRLRNERGQTTTEYAMIIGFLAVGIIIAIVFLRDEIVDLFRRSGSSLHESPGP
jgi:Flp pilus assembly pilin Flp